MHLKVGLRRRIFSKIHARRRLKQKNSKQKIQPVLFSVVLCLILCYKRNGSWFGVLRRLWMHLGSWENTQKSRVALSRLWPRPTLTLVSCPPKFLRASITRWSKPSHEPFPKCHQYNAMHRKTWAMPKWAPRNLGYFQLCEVRETEHKIVLKLQQQHIPTHNNNIYISIYLYIWRRHPCKRIFVVNL